MAQTTSGGTGRNDHFGTREAQANLEQYAKECRLGPVVVTLNGEPAFEMLPMQSDDPTFLDRLIEENAEFELLLASRRQEQAGGRVISLEELRSRLYATPMTRPT